MLEGKKYRAVDMLFPIVSGFIGHVTWYTKSPKITRVGVSYSPLLRTVV